MIRKKLLNILSPTEIYYGFGTEIKQLLKTLSYGDYFIIDSKDRGAYSENTVRIEDMQNDSKYKVMLESEYSLQNYPDIFSITYTIRPISDRYEVFRKH